MPISTRTTGTLITATIWNGLVNAINNTMAHKSGGQTLESFSTTAKEIGHYVGEIISHVNSADKGNSWLRCDGRTIGASSSGATARANIDMLALYTELWTVFDNTVLPIQTSSGSPTTRGVSAADDFTNNKRLPLPDMRGRVVIGMDNPGSGAANRITASWADTNGGTGGTETVTLASGEIPAHTHGFGAGTSFINGNGGAGTTYNNTGANTGTFSVATANNSPAGNAHNNTQPSIALNYFIYTGN